MAEKLDNVNAQNKFMLQSGVFNGITEYGKTLFDDNSSKQFSAVAPKNNSTGKVADDTNCKVQHL